MEIADRVFPEKVSWNLDLSLRFFTGVLPRSPHKFLTASLHFPRHVISSRPAFTDAEVRLWVLMWPASSVRHELPLTFRLWVLAPTDDPCQSQSLHWWAANSIPSLCFGYYQGFMDFLFHVLQSVTIIIGFDSPMVPTLVSGISFKLAPVYF